MFEIGDTLTLKNAVSPGPAETVIVVEITDDHYIVHWCHELSTTRSAYSHQLVHDSFIKPDKNNPNFLFKKRKINNG